MALTKALLSLAKSERKLEEAFEVEKHLSERNNTTLEIHVGSILLLLCHDWSVIPHQ